MRTFFLAVAISAAVGTIAGCNGTRGFNRRAGTVRLPTAPALEPSPEAVDPDKVGTVGEPRPASDGISPVPTLSPFGD